MGKLHFESYDDVFKFYEHFKDEDDEYLMIVNNGEKIHLDHCFFRYQKHAVVSTQDYGDKIGKVVVRDRIVNRFHPNNINNQRFWRLAKTKYPLISVNGSHCKNIDECNNNTLKFAFDMGIINMLNIKINMNHPNKINLLEIGYGHGNLYNKIKDIVNYVGIDYYKISTLKEEDKLLVIKKSGIPKKIKNNSLDIVYSFNVLQHCSQIDRFNYFSESYDKLKSGGMFLGGMFMVTPENKNESYWGVEDKNGRKYTIFFNQLTEVDTYEEFYNYVTKAIGFDVKIIKFMRNYCSFVLIKP